MAVQASVLQSTPPYPPELELVLAEPVGSRTESGVIKPSSEPGSDKGKNLQSQKKLESPLTPFVVKIWSTCKEKRSEGNPDEEMLRNEMGYSEAGFWKSEVLNMVITITTLQEMEQKR